MATAGAVTCLLTCAGGRGARHHSVARRTARRDRGQGCGRAETWVGRGWDRRADALRHVARGASHREQEGRRSWRVRRGWRERGRRAQGCAGARCHGRSVITATARDHSGAALRSRLLAGGNGARGPRIETGSAPERSRGAVEVAPKWSQPGPDPLEMAPPGASRPRQKSEVDSPPIAFAQVRCPVGGRARPCDHKPL